MSETEQTAPLQHLPQKNNKKIYAVIILAVFVISTLLIGILFVASQNSKQQQVQQVQNVPAQTIRIANIGEFSIFNLVAQEKGYFKANGLDAIIKEYDAGPSAITSLLAGENDVAVAAEFVGVRNIFTNENLRILSQSSKHRTFHVLARKDKGIKVETDLKKKKIGVTRKSAGEFFLGRFLTFHNLTIQDITMVDLPPADLISKLKSGELDAIIIFDPHAFKLKQDLGDAITEWSAQDQQKTYALFYSTQSVIDAKPDMISKYLTALVSAEQYVKNNPEETKKYMARALKYDETYINFMWPNFTFELGLDHDLLLAMEDQAEWLIDNKIIEQKKVPNYLNFMYFDGLEKVKPNSISIIR